MSTSVKRARNTCSLHPNIVSWSNTECHTDTLRLWSLFKYIIMPNCTNEPCNTSPVRTKILYMYPIVASQHAQSHTCTLYFATFTPGGKSGNARLISGPMVTYMRNGYMKAAEMGPFYILVREAPGKPANDRKVLFELGVLIYLSGIGALPLASVSMSY